MKQIILAADWLEDQFLLKNRTARKGSLASNRNEKETETSHGWETLCQSWIERL